MIARGSLAGLLGLLLAGCSTTGPIVFNCNGFEGPDGYGQEDQPSPLVARIRGEAVPDAAALVEAAVQPDRLPEKAQTPEQAMAAQRALLERLGQSLIKKRILTLDDAFDRTLIETAKEKLQKLRPQGTWLAVPPPSPATPIKSTLLLSGGGQWGAFGAGFLARLHERGFDQTHNFTTITGVSTGAFQALFVAAGTDKAYQELAHVYAPESESRLVRRYRPSQLAAFTGEMAAIARLRGELETALCDPKALAKALKSDRVLTRGEVQTLCPLIAQVALAGGSSLDPARDGEDTPLARNAFIGMVRADDGRFVIANATQIARDVIDRPATAAQVKNAQQCITGIGLASAAMPLFYQQVRIGDKSRDVAPRTYFDGGVRQSVFEADIARKEQKSAEKMPIFVLRNGPTHLLKRGPVEGQIGDRDQPGGDPAPNRKPSGIDAAMRAEQIVVNQIEVQSIADLRLTNPQADIRFITADGFHQFIPPAETETCTKRTKAVMFDPKFMRCLQAFGRASADKGSAAEHWVDAWRDLGGKVAPAQK